MGLLESILHDEATAAGCDLHSARVHRVGLVAVGSVASGAAMVIAPGIADDARLFEPVAQVEEPNPLLTLARGADLPDGYGEYPGTWRDGEEEDEGAPFFLTVPPEADADLN